MGCGVEEELTGGLGFIGKWDRYDLSTVDLGLKAGALERTHRLKCSFFIYL
jgi:hypothetical protein